jgi:hypothetical protein
MKVNRIADALRPTIAPNAEERAGRLEPEGRSRHRALQSPFAGRIFQAKW